MSQASTKAAQRTTVEHGVAQPFVRSLPTRARPASDRRASRRALIGARQRRLAVLVLLVLAAAWYVTPLRAFLHAQDGYFAQVAALGQGRLVTRALQSQLAEMHSEAYLVRQEREQWQLIPAGMQAFVVKGLPQSATDVAPSSVASARRISLGMRLRDLWRTLCE
jgi:hypothetical protein